MLLWRVLHKKRPFFVLINEMKLARVRKENKKKRSNQGKSNVGERNGIVVDGGQSAISAGY